MAASFPQFSWAVVLCPSEAYFNPVASKANPNPVWLDWSAVDQIKHLLGGKWQSRISYDPKIKTSIWYHERVEIKWPEDLALLMKHANRALSICRMIDYLHAANFQLTRKQFLDLVKNVGQAAVIQTAINYLHDKEIPVTQEDLSLLLANGSSIVNINEIVVRIFSLYYSRN